MVFRIRCAGVTLLLFIVGQILLPLTAAIAGDVREMADSTSFSIGVSTPSGGKNFPVAASAGSILSPAMEKEAISGFPKDGGGIKHFGHDFFEKPYVPRDTTMVSPSYLLSSGDNIKITFYGSINQIVAAAIDGEGHVNFPKVGKLKLGGASIAEAEKTLQKAFGRHFSDFYLKVGLDEPGLIRIFATGEFKQPGVYNLSSMATLVDAVLATGGPAQNGSLRNVQLIRNNQVAATFDFYDLLLRGNKSKDVRLQSDDVIRIPPKGPKVAISGAIKKPAIYELAGKDKLSELVAMAGGFTDTAYLQRLQIQRIDAHTEKKYVDVNYEGVANGSSPDILLEDGDSVAVYSILNTYKNSVEIRGNVFRPGTYEYRPGMRVSDLLNLADGVDHETYYERAQLVRLNEPDFIPEIIEFNLGRLISGDESQDLELKRYDSITVYRNPSVMGYATIRGEVNAPGDYGFIRGERISAVVKKAGGFTVRAFPKGSLFIRQSVRNLEALQNSKFTQLQLSNLLNQGSYVQNSADAAAIQQVISSQKELIALISKKQVQGAIIMDLETVMKDPALDLALEDGDMILVPETPSTVYVQGEVYSPGSVAYRKNLTFDQYIVQVGGFNKNADKEQIHIVRANGEVVREHATSEKILPGDTIVIPTNMEPKVTGYKFWTDSLDSLFKLVAIVATVKILSKP